MTTDKKTNGLPSGSGHGAASPARPFPVMMGTILAVIVTAGLYLLLGQPGVSVRPFQDQARLSLPTEPPPVAVSPQAPPLDEATERLARRLENQPSDVQGWILLARSYQALGKSEKARATFQRTLERFPDNVDLRIAYGESLIKASDGRVTEEARLQFDRVLSIAPDHSGAGYYLALYDYQNARVQDAYDRWRRLAEAAPPGAPWLPMVQRQLDLSAIALGITPPRFSEVPADFTPPPSAMPALSRQDVAAAMAMSPANRRAMIENMVSGLAARLEDHGEDLDGWMRLGRSYGVLGRWDQSVDAYRRALALAPQDESLQAALREAERRAAASE